MPETLPIQTKRHFLLPSTLYATKLSHDITTVLGSCVAVCLYDEKLLFGGMNHFMLPVWNDEGLATAKYGNIAIPRLIERMLSLGSDKKNIVAKVFGGSNSLMENNIYEVGKRNIQIAFELLQRYEIPVLKSDIGGKHGRKIMMNTATNRIYLKYV
ncbi:MAG: chemotaxis protein CheD [Bacteroidota bacterium]